MSVYVVQVDVSEGNVKREAEVTNQQIVLGRTFLTFSCDDMRVSRNQGLLTHKSDAVDYVTIKSTHLNPIYYKVDGSTNIEVLSKENEVSLRHDDQFGFLPDKCWYKISIKKTDLETEGASLVLRVRAVAELNDSQNFADIIPQVSNNQHVDEIASSCATSQNDMITLQTPDFTFDGLPHVLNEPVVESSQESQEPELPLPQVTHDPEAQLPQVSHLPEEQVPQVSNEPEVAVPLVSNEPVVNVPQVSSEPEVRQVTVKREAEEVSSGSPKRQRTDNPTSSTSDDVPQGAAQSDVTTTSNEPSSSTAATIVKKEEPDSTGQRDSCPFGVKCYRRTIEHRRELAHPGDTDYRRPNFPPAPPGSPMCPYGPRCYRRNPDHFQQFAHPPSTAALGSCSSSNSNTASSSTMPAWIPRPLRQPKREEVSENDLSEDDNEWDFSDGEDDDDFQLNGVSQETSDEISLGSDVEESDDNSAILDDGDANED